MDTPRYWERSKPAYRLVLDICRDGSVAAARLSWRLTKTALIVAAFAAVAAPFVVAYPFCMHRGDVAYY